MSRPNATTDEAEALGLGTTVPVGEFWRDGPIAESVRIVEPADEVDVR